MASKYVMELLFMFQMGFKKIFYHGFNTFTVKAEKQNWN